LAVGGASRRTHEPAEIRVMVASLAGGWGSRRKPEAANTGDAEARHRRREPGVLTQASWRSVLGEGRELDRQSRRRCCARRKPRQQVSLAGARNNRCKPEVKRAGQPKDDVRRKPEASHRQRWETGTYRAICKFGSLERSGLVTCGASRELPGQRGGRMRHPVQTGGRPPAKAGKELRARA